MGSRKKSKNNSTSTNSAQMAELQRANPGATMGQMQQTQQGMQNKQLEDVMGAFNQMKQAGDAQMGENPMAALMTQLFGEGPQGSNVMFDMSQFKPPAPAQQQQPQTAPVSPFMRGQYIVNQGMANGGQMAPPRFSLYDQINGVPYAGIPQDV